MVVLNILSRTSSTNPNRRCRRVQLHLITNKHTHTHGQIAFGRNPLDKGSACRRDFYLARRNTNKRLTPMPTAEFWVLVNWKIESLWQTYMPPAGFWVLVNWEIKSLWQTLDVTDLSFTFWVCCPLYTASVTYPVRLNTDRKLTHQETNALFRS